MRPTERSGKFRGVTPGLEWHVRFNNYALSERPFGVPDHVRVWRDNVNRCVRPNQSGLKYVVYLVSVAGLEVGKAHGKGSGAEWMGWGLWTRLTGPPKRKTR